jgi:hypothetical protein
VEVLAAVALTDDSGPIDAGCGCPDRWFSSSFSAASCDSVSSM